MDTELNPDPDTGLAMTPYDRLYQFVPVGAPNYSMLRLAREVIAEVPERQFDLSQIVSEIGAAKTVGSIAADGDLSSGCGTIACAAGWLALTPDFQALGLTAVRSTGRRDKQFVLAYKGVSTENQSAYDLATAPLFNLTLKQAEDLFAARDQWGDDDCLPEGTSDKDAFLARIDALLAAETPAE